VLIGVMQVNLLSIAAGSGFKVKACTLNLICILLALIEHHG